MSAVKVAALVAAGVAAATAGSGTAAAAPATNTPTREIVVRERVLREEAAVGPYKQPEWTLHRRFPTTRVYLQYPPYEIGAEQWWRMTVTRAGETKHRFQEEVGMGLPHRFQVDAYENWTVADGVARQENIALEVRYALADWGRIPMNPTLYVEYKFAAAGADALEAKLLLGDEIGCGWRYGVNAVYEQELGGARTTEMALAGALGWTVLDQKLSVGSEVKYVSVTEAETRGTPEEEMLLGPSLQWRPTASTHLDVVPLFGLTEASPSFMSYVTFGVDFGSVRGAKGPVAPKSTIAQ